MCSLNMYIIYTYICVDKLEKKLAVYCKKELNIYVIFALIKFKKIDILQTGSECDMYIECCMYVHITIKSFKKKSILRNMINI